MTEEKMEKIEHLITLSGIGDMFWRACINVRRNAEMNNQYAGLSPEQVSAVFTKVLSDLIVGALAVLDYRFSDEEIDELLQLYNHPLVQRFISLTPELHQAARDLNRHGACSPSIPIVPNFHPNTVH